MVRARMAARKKNNVSDEETSQPESSDEPIARKRRSSPLVLWLEEAWEGWLKSVSTILALVAAYLLYRFDLVSDSFAGLALVLLLLGGAFYSTVPQAWPLARTPLQKGLFGVFLLVWAAAVVYPSLRTAIPPRSLGDTHITTAQLSSTLHLKGTGPYELTVSGHFKQQGMSEAEANYSLKATSGSTSDEIYGALKRSLVTTRVSRRGGTSTSLKEETEQTHRLPHVLGSDVTIATDSVDDQLEDGLTVSVRPAGIDPTMFWILGALACVLALVLDSRLTDVKGKLRGYLAVAAGTTFMFALFFPESATPHSLVRPAVGDIARGLLVGGLGGWFLGSAGRLLFGPKIKKARR
jgi:hypothetical protein